MITKKINVDKTYEIVDQTLFCEHSRITDLYDEIVIQQCIDSAHDAVEQWMNRPLYTTTFIGLNECFATEILLPNPTVKSINSVTAQDIDYNIITLVENVDWVFDDINESIVFLRTSPNEPYKLTKFRITYQSGYNNTDDPVPAAVVSAILMTAATLYENREDSVIGTQVNKVPLDAQRLLRLHRRRPM